MSYKIAGIDVHKKMLAVVVSDVEIESEYQFERRMFSSNPEQLRSLLGIGHKAQSQFPGHQPLHQAFGIDEISLPSASPAIGQRLCQM